MTALFIGFMGTIGYMLATLVAPVLLFLMAVSFVLMAFGFVILTRYLVRKVKGLFGATS